MSGPSPEDVNGDESAFKSHVLYYVPGDQRCDQLIRFLDVHPVGEMTWFQNARDIPPAQRPQWLRTVPILVDKERKKAHIGNNIYQYLQQWGASAEDGGDFVPANDYVGSMADFEDFDWGFGIGGGPAGFDEVGAFSLEEDDENDTRRELGTVSDRVGGDRAVEQQNRAVQDYVQQREEQDRRMREYYLKMHKTMNLRSTRV